MHKNLKWNPKSQRNTTTKKYSDIFPADNNNEKEEKKRTKSYFDNAQDDTQANVNKMPLT